MVILALAARQRVVSSTSLDGWAGLITAPDMSCLGAAIYVHVYRTGRPYRVFHIWTKHWSAIPKEPCIIVIVSSLGSILVDREAGHGTIYECERCIFPTTLSSLDTYGSD